jgi:hypothetical protein
MGAHAARVGAVSARVGRWVLAIVLPGTIACASGPPGRASNAAGRDSPIAAVHAHRCGRCHAPPEPGEYSRARLEDAFTRHKRRVRLTEDQWRAMLQYLAAPQGPTAMQGPANGDGPSDPAFR